jgi:hypothetical protein
VTRARSALWWSAPPILCLILYWQGFTAWFRADDFAWLGAGIYIQNFHDLLAALFAPQAQGTIRPLSERAFFMTGFGLFGLDALPFKIVVFATQFASLGLMASIGARLTGSRAAGLCAAILWVLNSALVEPLGWTCVYNEVLCGFFLLLAFHNLLRWIETGRRRYEIAQWIAFLVGFGALELNLVYPAIAGAYTLLVTRKYFRRVLPMFAISIAYVLLHNAVAPVQKTGDYAMHFTGAILRTLATYWTWTVGPTFLFSPFALASWVLPTGVAIVTIGLGAFTVAKLRSGSRLPLFFLAWFLATLAPVLPLRDHVTEYYVYLPAIGLAWLGGWALVEGWRAGAAARTAAVALTAIYAAMALPDAIAASQWNHAITIRVRNLVEGVAGIHERNPSKSIVLEGVDTDLFWNGVLDKPFRLFGLDHVYLTPESESRIAAHQDLGDIAEFVLPADVLANALGRDQAVVYDVRGPRLRNITASYAGRVRDTAPPSRIDVASPLTSYLLGPEWYPSDGNHRWMPKRATLRIGGHGNTLVIRGMCPEEQRRGGPLAMSVRVDGVELTPAAIKPDEDAFEIALPLPAPVAARTGHAVEIEVSRTFRPPSDQRDLGLAFGVFEVR